MDKLQRTWAHLIWASAVVCMVLLASSVINARTHANLAVARMNYELASQRLGIIRRAPRKQKNYQDSGRTL